MFDLFPRNVVAFIVFYILVSLAILESHLVIQFGWRRVLPHDDVLGIMVDGLLRVGRVDLSGAYSPVRRVADVLTSCEYLVVPPIHHILAIERFIVIILHLILLIEEH